MELFILPEYVSRSLPSVIKGKHMFVCTKWAQKFASSRVAPQDVSILSQHKTLGQGLFVLSRKV